jgi:hypothetical protein
MREIDSETPPSQPATTALSQTLQSWWKGPLCPRWRQRPQKLSPTVRQLRFYFGPSCPSEFRREYLGLARTYTQIDMNAGPENHSHH